MDDGRLVGTSSSTRSPSGEQHAGEIRTSHSRRPSYVDESIPPNSSLRREARYSTSPPRLHDGTRYDGPERSPYAPLGYTASPLRTHHPQRSWEANRTFRPDEEGYARERSIPPNNAAPGEKPSWRAEDDWNGRRVSGGYGSRAWEEGYWRERDVNEPSEGWTRRPGEWPARDDAHPPVRRSGENDPYPPSPRYYGRFSAPPGPEDHRLPMNGAYGPPSDYPPLRSPNGRYDGFRDNGGYDYYRGPAHSEHPLPVEPGWDSQASVAGPYLQKHPSRPDSIQTSFHDSPSRIVSGPRSADRRRGFDGQPDRRGSDSRSPSLGATITRSPTKTPQKAPVNGDGYSLGSAFRSQSGSRYGRPFLSPCETPSRKASMSSTAYPALRTTASSASTPSYHPKTDESINLRLSEVRLSPKPSPRPASPRSSPTAAVLSETTTVSKDLLVDEAPEGTTSNGLSLPNGKSPVVPMTTSRSASAEPVVVKGETTPPMENGPTDIEVEAVVPAPGDPRVTADALVAEVLDDETLKASFAEARPRVMERATEWQNTLEELIQRVRSRYLHLNQQWKAQCERLDRVTEGRKKRFALQSLVTPATAGLTHFFSEESPIVGGRTSRRTGNVFFGDAVRSDLELESIIEKLQMEESQDASFRARRTAASIPDMDAVRQDRIALQYNDSNNLIDDPGEFFTVSQPADSWTSAEEQLFAARYALFPKQFGEIASGMGTKTAAQCVTYYYLNKRRLDFRGKSTTGKRKAGRRAGRGKGSLMADIQAAEEKVKKALGIDQSNAGIDDPTVEYSTPQEDDGSTEPESPGPSTAGAMNGVSEDDPSAMDVDAADSRSVDEGMQDDMEVAEQLLAPAGSRSLSNASVGPMGDAGTLVRKRRSHLDADTGNHPRKKPATSSYWSVQEKLTAVVSHEKHAHDYPSIAADIGTKSAVQVRNFFQNQTSEALAELSERAKGLNGQVLLANRSDGRRSVPVYFDHERETVTVQARAPSITSTRPIKEEVISMEPMGAFSHGSHPTPVDVDPSPPRQPVSHGEAPDFSRASITPRPIHSLPPISSLPFPSGSGYRSPPRSRLPISSLLNDVQDEAAIQRRNDAFDDWFGTTKASPVKQFERRPYERIELPRIPEPWHRGESSAAPPLPARDTIEHYHSQTVDYDVRRPAFPAAGGASLRPRSFPDVPPRLYSPPPLHHPSAESQRYGYSSHAPRTHTPDAPYPPSAYGPPRSTTDGWRGYDARQDWPARHEYSYRSEPQPVLPPASSAYLERRPSYGAYPPSDFQPIRPPSPHYNDYPYGVQPSSTPEGYDSRRLPPSVRDYGSYRPPTPPPPLPLPREPPGYYDGPDDYFRRPPLPPVSQWPEEQERRRYPPEFPDYPDDRRYRGP